MLEGASSASESMSIAMAMRRDCRSKRFCCVSVSEAENFSSAVVTRFLRSSRETERMSLSSLNETSFCSDLSSSFLARSSCSTTKPRASPVTSRFTSTFCER